MGTLLVQLDTAAEYDVDAVTDALRRTFPGYDVRVSEGLGTVVDTESTADTDRAWQAIRAA